MCVLLVRLLLWQGKADEWRRSWGLKASMAYELYIHLANVMKVGQHTGGGVIFREVGCRCSVVVIVVSCSWGLLCVGVVLGSAAQLAADVTADDDQTNNILIYIV